MTGGLLMYSFSAIDANVTSVLVLDLNIGNDHNLVKKTEYLGKVDTEWVLQL
jgi:hypothetical protein